MQLLFLYGRVMITLLVQPVLLPGKAAATQGRGILGKHNEKQAKSISTRCSYQKQGYSSDCAARPRYDNQPAIGTNPHGE